MAPRRPGCLRAAGRTVPVDLASGRIGPTHGAVRPEDDQRVGQTIHDRFIRPSHTVQQVLPRAGGPRQPLDLSPSRSKGGNTGRRLVRDGQAPPRSGPASCEPIEITRQSSARTTAAIATATIVAIAGIAPSIPDNARAAKARTGTAPIAAAPSRYCARPHDGLLQTPGWVSVGGAGSTITGAPGWT